MALAWLSGLVTRPVAVGTPVGPRLRRTAESKDSGERPGHVSHVRGLQLSPGVCLLFL